MLKYITLPLYIVNQEKCEVGFGPHLTLDLYSCDKSVLNDENLIREFLHTLPDMLAMNKISEPSITKYLGKEDSFDKGGISAFVLIAESHISIHTFVEQRHAFIDIFSCKDFDVEKAVQFICEKFRPERVDKKLFGRGLEFPRNVEAVKEIIHEERKGVK